MEKNNLKVQNVVATVNLDTKLDLYHITKKTKRSKYNPQRFAAVTLKIPRPRTTALVFSTGKMVVTGSKNEAEAHRATRMFAKKIQRLGYNIAFLNFKIQNIVSTFSMKATLHLERLAFAHSTFIRYFFLYFIFFSIHHLLIKNKNRYDPELFTGLNYRMTNPSVVFLIFSSGKVIITGAKTTGQAKEAFDKMLPILVNYVKF